MFLAVVLIGELAEMFEAFAARFAIHTAASVLVLESATVSVVV